MTHRILPQAHAFTIRGEPILCAPYGNGHINRTYLVVDTTGDEYILQMINKTVFRDPAALMRNVAAVTARLRQAAKSPRESLRLVETRGGAGWHVDEQGEYWRLYRFVSDSMCLERAESPDDFRESAVAFGRFAMQLADFPADTLAETIPRFHDTPSRYAALREAAADDVSGRAAAVARELDFALEREPYADTLSAMRRSGELPLRVTHNDTKLNNVLFDRDTRRALCVIDLDTVMPGLTACDFGDSIRFGAATGAEDERDLSRISFSMPLYEAYCDGFLSTLGASVTECERLSLRDGAKMMTLECGVRFLTDYLAGDVYFRTSRDGHNLDRCRTQFKLVEGMEAAWDRMLAPLEKSRNEGGRVT